MQLDRRLGAYLEDCIPFAFVIDLAMMELDNVTDAESILSDFYSDD